MLIDIDNDSNDKSGSDSNYNGNSRRRHENIIFKVMYSVCVVENL